ncbi:MAG: S8 family serine peptidase [Bacteroidota bacterium]
MALAPEAAAQFPSPLVTGAPDDPIYDTGGSYTADPGQWNLRKINMPQAWDLTTGSEDIIVAVIDDAFDLEHPDLADALWINEEEDLDGDGVYTVADENFFDDDGNGYEDDVNGRNFANFVLYPEGQKEEIQSVNGSDAHGTRSAGVIFANSDNTRNIAGIAGGRGTSNTPRVRFMPIRINTSFNAVDDWVISIGLAVEYARKSGADVISMSLEIAGTAGNVQIPNRGGTTANTLIQEALDAGIVIVAASGNAEGSTPGGPLKEEDAGNGGGGPGLSICTDLNWPASYNGVISVGATRFNDALWIGSCGNPDLVAPGGEMTIPSLRHHRNPNGSLRSTSDIYFDGLINPSLDRLFGGTSASTPHVAGVAALMLSINPTMTRQEVASTLTATADASGCSAPNPSKCGAGRLDAYAALTHALANYPLSNATVERGWDVGTATLEFEPGAKLTATRTVLSDSTVLTGDLYATGTTFTAEVPASGWGGLRLENGTTATLSGGSLVDDAAVDVLGGTFTLDDSVIQDAGIYASGSSSQVTVRNRSEIRGASTWGLFVENGADAFIEDLDTSLESNSEGIRSRGSGSTITLADEAKIFNNDGDGVFTDLYGKVLFATSGQPFTIEDNDDGLRSETASEINSQNASHRIIDNSAGAFAYDVFGMDFSTTNVDLNYWGPTVTSSSDLDVLNGDAIIIIDPVLTTDPSSGARVAMSDDPPEGTGLPYASALGTDTVQGWAEAAVEALSRGDAEGAVDAVRRALNRAETASERGQAWAAAARVAIDLQEMEASPGASAWARLAALARARLSSAEDAPWARRTLALGALMHPGRGVAERTAETRGHLVALRALPERTDLAAITARRPQREGTGGSSGAPLSHAAFAGLMEIRLALEAGEASGARSALASLAAVDPVQAEVASIGVEATFPDLDVTAALAEGQQEGRQRQAEAARQATAEGLTVHPNPTTGALRLRFGMAETASVEIAVFDGLGRQVAEVASGDRDEGVYTEAVDLSSLPAGVYLVRMTVQPADGGASRAEVRRIAVVR